MENGRQRGQRYRVYVLCAAVGSGLYLRCLVVVVVVVGLDGSLKSIRCERQEIGE